MNTTIRLKKVTTPEERVVGGLTVEQRLSTRMSLIIASIKSCAKLCDSYQRRHVARTYPMSSHYAPRLNCAPSLVKFLTSVKWQQRFTDVAQQFVDHQNAIQLDLQMYISIEIANVNETLSTLNKNVTSMMQMVFNRMQSPAERELANFVKSKGGVVTSPDDKLLQEVIKYFQQQQQQQKEGKDRKQNKGSPGSDFPVDLTSFKKELNKEIDDILVANGKVFERAFGAIEISLKEVKGTIVHETDRAIETILAEVSPQERIVDSVSTSAQ